MASTEDRDWVEITSKLLLPLVLGVVGFWIPYKTHKDDLSRQDAESQQSKKRQEADAEENRTRIEFERETGFVKMLASSNDDEQQLAIALITAIPPTKRDGQVKAALSSLCAPNIKVGLKDRACDVLSSSAGQVAQRSPNAGQSAGDGPVVYIQIASEDQRQDAENLITKLTQDHFRAAPIQKVNPPLSTVHTYVRFFAASSAVQAARLADDMSALNYKAVGVQDFSAYTDKASATLEIWIGSSQKKVTKQ